MRQRMTVLGTFISVLMFIVLLVSFLYLSVVVLLWSPSDSWQDVWVCLVMVGWGTFIDGLMFIVLLISVLCLSVVVLLWWSSDSCQYVWVCFVMVGWSSFIDGLMFIVLLISFLYPSVVVLLWWCSDSCQYVWVSSVMVGWSSLIKAFRRLKAFFLNIWLSLSSVVPVSLLIAFFLLSPWSVRAMMPMFVIVLVAFSDSLRMQGSLLVKVFVISSLLLSRMMMRVTSIVMSMYVIHEDDWFIALTFLWLFTWGLMMVCVLRFGFLALMAISLMCEYNFFIFWG